MTLADLTADAARAAFLELFVEEPGHYYYCALITTGEALWPFVAAWSEEAFEHEASNYPDLATAERSIRWSYADSPHMVFGERHFEEVKREIARRPDSNDLSPEDWEHEYETRLVAMEEAMRRLDGEGIFGRGEQRDGLVLLVEVMPPDITNTERAYRLNDPQGSMFNSWLREAAEQGLSEKDIRQTVKETHARNRRLGPWT